MWLIWTNKLILVLHCIVSYIAPPLLWSQKEQFGQKKLTTCEVAAPRAAWNGWLHIIHSEPAIFKSFQLNTMIIENACWCDDGVKSSARRLLLRARERAQCSMVYMCCICHWGCAALARQKSHCSICSVGMVRATFKTHTTSSEHSSAHWKQI
jgi:hypothetical protein